MCVCFVPVEFKVLKKVKFKGGEPELLSLVLDEATHRPKQEKETARELFDPNLFWVHLSKS